MVAVIRIVAVSGYKNSGKSTWCRRLLEELRILGIRTGYIKRTSEQAVASSGSTDTGSVLDMGFNSILWGDDGIRLESKSEVSSLHEIASRYFPDSELLILEGGKELAVPKIWVRSGKEDIPKYPGIFMVYDRLGCSDGKMLFGAGAEPEMAKRLSSLVRGSAYRSARIYIGDRPLPMKDFISDFVRGGILGMLASLKGGKSLSEPVRIYLDASEKNDN